MSSLTRRTSFALERRASLALDWLLPQVCIGCEMQLPAGWPRSLIARPEPGAARLSGWCCGCVGHLLASNAYRCPVCGERDEPNPGDLPCAACCKTPPAFDFTLVVTDYAPPMDRLIQALKFGRRSALAAPMGELLGQVAASAIESGLVPQPSLVSAIPLAERRLAERGFNQSTLLARAVADRLDLPLQHRLLRRAHLQRSAATLDALGRRAALAHAFSPVEAGCPGATVLLIDDVMTTGTTLQQAAAALKRAGAARVMNCVLARTPRNVAARRSTSLPTC